jgi:penicillin-binding protein 1A
MKVAFRRYFGSLLFAALLVVSIALGATGGVLFVYNSDLPQVESLEAHRPNVITEVYGDDGQVIGSFALERRLIVEGSQIPPVLKDALVSVEDQNFYSHWGLDFYGISRAALKNILAGRVVEGGSTITQQLAENLFLSPQREWALKLQEALFSIQIERRYTKEEILTLYSNQIYLGHGMYGFAAASDFYFGKNIRDLTLEEAATLAALPRAPGLYSPLSNPERGLMRRNYVIDRMVAEGKVPVDEGEQAKQRPIRLKALQNRDQLAPYFVEELRQYLEETYGTYAVHEGGLRVYSTLNARMQRAAEDSLRQGLRDYDKRHGWRGITTNLIENGFDDIESHALDAWKRPLRDGDIVPGIVLEANATSATIRVGEYRDEVTRAGIAWTGQRSPGAILSRGDVAEFLVQAIDPAEQTIELSLEQLPMVQGSLIAIDQRTGEVKTMVGGYDFEQSKFNRATQALRQTGSVFKPLLYTAALDYGMRPDHLIEDEPVDFDGYKPTNYDERYVGPISLRRALAESRNIPAVQVLNEIGFDTLIPMVARFGIRSVIEPYLPIALGATDMNLIELTSAYSTFPNDGVRVEPRLINRVTDYDGDILEENFPQPHDVISSDLAAEMVDLLSEVVRSGTAVRAQSLGRPAGGKTGTTNDFTDAWFMGFTPSLTAGVWVGFDEKVTLGSGETGGRTALPIWISFMEQVYEDTPIETFEQVSPDVLENTSLTDRSQP